MQRCLHQSLTCVNVDVQRFRNCHLHRIINSIIQKSCDHVNKLIIAQRKNDRIQQHTDDCIQSAKTQTRQVDIVFMNSVCRSRQMTRQLALFSKAIKLRGIICIQ